MTTDKTPATLATAKHGGCVQLGDGLLPCPFCGNGAEFVPYKNNGLTLKCKSMGCIQRHQRTLRYGIEWLRTSMTEHWNARALAAQPSPGGQGEEPTSVSRAYFNSWAQAQGFALDGDDKKYYSQGTQGRWEAWQAALVSYAARQPGAQVPVTTAPQPGKRVSILESACGPARKFDPVAADAELASVPLVPLWELPELHPRKVADECLTTMEQVRQGTKPHTSRRHKLTEAIALTKRFIEQQERSERLGTAPPAQAVDLGMPIAMIDQALRRLSTTLDDLQSSADRRPAVMVAEAIGCLHQALMGIPHG